MRGHSPHLRAAIVFVVLSACWHSPSAHAQVPDIIAHPEHYTEVQDSVFIRRLLSDGRVLNDLNVISAAYRFEYVYDSTCRVQYTFSECMRNGVRPRLLAWKNRHIHSADETMMTDSSRTASFPLVIGDSISFYREFKWYEPKHGEQETNNFRSLDTLDYAVELVRTSTNARIALLDSFGVLASPTPSAPRFYGTQPIMAHIVYTVPWAAPGDSAFVRVRLYSRGDGPYLPIRKDAVTIGASRNITFGKFDHYLSLFGGSLNKRNVNELNTATLQDSPLLAVSTISEEIRINFSEPEGDGPIEVVIYDALGNRVFVPYSTRAMSSPESIKYRAPSGGTYFVALLRNGAIIAVKQAIVSF